MRLRVVLADALLAPADGLRRFWCANAAVPLSKPCSAARPGLNVLRHPLPLLRWQPSREHAKVAGVAAELAAAALAASKSKSRPAFERGEPFRPYQQLLAVLPAASAAHLPEPFRPLMLEATSPIADFYPADFDVDLEGKRAEWEGVVLIPFVDEERLLEAAARVPEGALSAHERALNRPGEVLLWTAIEGGGGGASAFFAGSGFFSSPQPARAIAVAAASNVRLNFENCIRPPRGAIKRVEILRTG